MAPRRQPLLATYDELRPAVRRVTRAERLREQLAVPPRNTRGHSRQQTVDKRRMTRNATCSAASCDVRYARRTFRRWRHYWRCAALHAHFLLSRYAL